MVAHLITTAIISSLKAAPKHRNLSVPNKLSHQSGHNPVSHSLSPSNDSTISRIRRKQSDHQNIGEMKLIGDYHWHIISNALIPLGTNKLKLHNKIIGLYQSTQAVLIKYHRLHGLNNRNLFSQFWRLWEVQDQDTG